MLLLISLMTSVEATSIGVSKAVINYQEVLKGGYAEETFVTSTDSKENVEIQYEFLGDIAEWLSIESEDDFQISINNPETIKLIVEPPNTVPNGVYEGVLRITTGQLTRAEGQFGSIIKSAFRIKVTVVITGRETQACSVGGIKISDTEYDQDLELSATIKNKGNVNLIPEFEIDIWNSEQTRLLKTYEIFSGRTIRPTQTVSLFQTFSHDLDMGQYFADVKVLNCGDKSTSTFEILDRGQVADKGELLQVYNQAWAKTNDIVPIAGNFQNVGERTVNVKLKGTILLNGKLVKVIDTDLVEVIPGELSKIETFFNPTEPGQYLIKVRALYNGKLTFEKESVLNVNPSGEPSKLDAFKLEWYPVVLFMLVVIAITLLFMIKKKNSKKKR